MIVTMIVLIIIIICGPCLLPWGTQGAITIIVIIIITIIIVIITLPDCQLSV